MKPFRIPAFGIALVLCLSFSAQLPAADSASKALANPGGGFTVKAQDGFDLWFDAWGEGPAIIFIARSPDENYPMADLLSKHYRVVVFVDRMSTLGVVDSINQLSKDSPMAGWADKNHDWDPAGNDSYPIDLMIDDLHRVADAAGVDDFVLGGYSGTARVAAIFAMQTPRAAGLIIGGWDHLSDITYWKGFTAAQTATTLLNPESSEISKSVAILARQLTLFQAHQDTPAKLKSVPGPKIVWMGSEDSQPQDEAMALMFWEASIAAGVREHLPQYQALGFQFFELEGLGHLDAYHAHEKSTPLIIKALRKAGYP